MRQYEFVQNRACEYFPCHKCKDTDAFNCLFCYCPLYALGENCGGNFTYTENGIKDCSDCTIPHIRGNFDRIVEKMTLVMEMARRKEKP